MKRLLTLLMMSLPIFGISQITTFPYYEDFETGSGGWSSSTLVGGDSWSFGTPDGSVINQSASGGSNSWYVDTLDVGINEQSHVISPVFDFTNVPFPALEIDIWWNLIYDSDGAVFQSSIDGGASWQNVGSHVDDPAFAPNWFNHGFLSMGFPNGGAGSQNTSHWTGDGPLGSGGWVTAGHILNGLGGEPNVQLRMAWINKTNNLGAPGNGIAFDNIHVYSAPSVDLEITDVSQAGPCGGGYPGTALVTIANFGAGTATVDFLQDSLGTNFPFDQTTITGFGSVQLAVQLPLQNPGDTAIHVGVNHAEDQNPDNNFFTASFNCNVVSGLNHCNNFEGDSLANWFVDPEGMNSSWGLGSNASNNTINTPFSGTNFWGTTGMGGGYNPNEQSSIVSPFFDFSNMENTGVSFQLWTDLETDYDGAVFQFSLDGGATWVNLGAQGTGSNWFNDGAVSGGGSGGQNTANWNGSSGGWVSASHPTTALEGLQNVLFRFSIGADDIFQDGGIGVDDFCTVGDAVLENDTPNLVINEVLITGDSAWIEIYNLELFDVQLTDHTLSVFDGVVGPLHNLTGSIPALGYRVFEFEPQILFNYATYRLRKGNIVLDALCIGDAGTLQQIGVECEQGNAEYGQELLAGCSLSRIANGADTDDAGDDFTMVESTLGAENLDQPCSFVGIDEEAAEDFGISVYPNPANDVISLRTGNSDLYDIQILDSMGRKVFTSGRANNINISTLNPGVYMIMANDNMGNASVARFIKQ